jgi:hypothetical protein
VDPAEILTLGDIHRVLTEMVRQGSHPGSIAWVLRHQVPCDANGNPALCDHCR